MTPSWYHAPHSYNTTKLEVFCLVAAAIFFNIEKSILLKFLEAQELLTRYCVKLYLGAP